MTSVPPSAAPAVAFQGISHAYRGVLALDGLDLAVADGEIVALLGPAGAGKSTALAILAGFAAPARGQVLVRGVPVTRTKARRRGLGVVLARPALFPGLSIAANVGLPLAWRGVRRAERRERVAAMLDLLGIADAARRKPGQLDAATRLRAALARASVFAPACLLLDDPLSDPMAGLAAEDRQGVLDDLRRLRGRTGMAVLLATREPALALGVADRVAVLSNGTLLQVDRPDVAYETPNGPEAAAILGEVNTLEGRLVAMEDDIATVRLRGGPLVAARMAAELADAGVIGERCVVCVRPERIAVAATEAVQLGENALPAVLDNLVYQGDHTRLRLLIGDGVALTVRRPAAAGPVRLRPGGPSAVAWPPSQAIAYRAR